MYPPASGKPETAVIAGRRVFGANISKRRAWMAADCAAKSSAYNLIIPHQINSHRTTNDSHDTHSPSRQKNILTVSITLYQIGEPIRRLANPGRIMLERIGFQTGSYPGGDAIIRIIDADGN